jgi:hypothetical protein
VDGDTRAPCIDATWLVTAVDPQVGWHTSVTGLGYRFVEHSRARPGAQGETPATRQA